MNLKDAELDERFQSFKYMGMIELAQYIAKATIYHSKHGDDNEVSEYLEAAKLIRDSRIGVKPEASEREAEYKSEWIKQHDKADEIVVDANSKKLVAAIYYYPPAHHEAEIQRIWKAIAATMELERLERGEFDD